MKKSKKGLSQVIAIILIILVAIVTVFIIWNVVKKTITEKSGEVGIEKFSVGLSTSEVNLSENPIKIPVTRKAGQGNITSIKIIFRDAAVDTKEVVKTDCIPNELETKICSIYRGEGEGNLTISFIPKFFEVYPIIKTSAGKEVIGLKAGISGGGGSSGGGSGSSTPEGEAENYYCSAVNIENYCNRYDGNYYNKSLCLGGGCNATQIWCNGADANRDGDVNELDSVFISNNLGKTGCGNPDWCNGADANRDGDVNELDYVHVSNNLGRTGCNLEENTRIDCYTISNCKDKNKELCNKESGCLWIPSQIQCENPFLKASWSSTLDILADGAFNKSGSKAVPSVVSVVKINEDYIFKVDNTNKSGCIPMPFQGTYHCFERTVQKYFDSLRSSWGGTIYVNLANFSSTDFSNPSTITEEFVFVGAYVDSTTIRNFAIGFWPDYIEEKFYIYMKAYHYNVDSGGGSSAQRIFLADYEESIPDRWIKIDWFLTPENNLFARVDDGEWKKIPNTIINKQLFSRIDIGYVSGFCREDCKGILYIKNITLYNENCLLEWMKDLES